MRMRRCGRGCFCWLTSTGGRPATGVWPMVKGWPAGRLVRWAGMGDVGGPAGYRVPRWALPGELAALDGQPRRRTARDWAVDVALFGFAVVMWLWAWADLNPVDPDFAAVVSGWMIVVDPWVGAAACVALWWRRRFPLALAIGMIPGLSLSSTATGAALVTLLTVAVHRGPLAATLVTVPQVVQAAWFSALYQHDDQVGPVGAALVAVVMFTAPLGWGIAVRARRQLMTNLRREAERQHREHELRLAQTRRAERARIAREMHDVLAHRISLLSVHAGALAYRTRQAEAGSGPALTAAETAEAVSVIRDNAHQALVELKEVLTVLRADEDADERAAPPPRLDDVGRLIEEARAAGQRVEWRVDAALTERPPRPQEQRTVYRVVQEGLTNARKHAPGAPVTVQVRPDGDGLEVMVSNPLPAHVYAAGIPGAGAGLTGLAERVALDGGQLSHGLRDGTFQLRARLPWRR